MERFDLALSLTQFGRRGETLADRLSVYFAGQTEVWAVAGLARLVTVAIGSSATGLDSRDGAAAKVAQMSNPGQDRGALLLEGADGVRQGASNPNVCIRSDYNPKKRKPPDRAGHVAHPEWAGSLPQSRPFDTL
jgi:hypothetical protein